VLDLLDRSLRKIAIMNIEQRPSLHNHLKRFKYADLLAVKSNGLHYAALLMGSTHSAGRSKSTQRPPQRSQVPDCRGAPLWSHI